MTKRVQHKQAARAVREQLAAERRRARTMWISIIAVAVLIIGGLVGYGIYQSNRPKDTTVPAGAVDGGHGIATGTGPVKVEIYLDFMCPACGKFERENGAKLTQQVTDNKITLVTHPVNFLDDASKGTKYSTRAGSASGCASDGGKFSEFTAAMFAGQPKENTAGLTDDEIVQIGGSVGLLDPTFAKCVRDKKYYAWMDGNTEEMAKRGVSSTPTFFVNGKKVDDPTDVFNSIEAAQTKK